MSEVMSMNDSVDPLVGRTGTLKLSREDSNNPNYNLNYSSLADDSQKKYYPNSPAVTVNLVHTTLETRDEQRNSSKTQNHDVSDFRSEIPIAR